MKFRHDSDEMVCGEVVPCEESGVPWTNLIETTATGRTP